VLASSASPVIKEKIEVLDAWIVRCRLGFRCERQFGSYEMHNDLLTEVDLRVTCKKEGGCIRRKVEV
jgi:CRISPR/Cas system CMR-associated protein Cmr1 (group 7 of RAMP superfamily)